MWPIKPCSRGSIESYIFIYISMKLELHVKCNFFFIMKIWEPFVLVFRQNFINMFFFVFSLKYRLILFVNDFSLINCFDFVFFFFSFKFVTPQIQFVIKCFLFIIFIFKFIYMINLYVQNIERKEKKTCNITINVYILANELQLYLATLSTKLFGMQQAM